MVRVWAVIRAHAFLDATARIWRVLGGILTWRLLEHVLSLIGRVPCGRTQEGLPARFKFSCVHVKDDGLASRFYLGEEVEPLPHRQIRFGTIPASGLPCLEFGRHRSEERRVGKEWRSR